MTFYFEDLKNLVIDRGFCTQCGTCTAVCKIIQMESVPNIQDLDYCTGCGHCPSANNNRKSVVCLYTL